MRCQLVAVGRRLGSVHRGSVSGFGLPDFQPGRVPKAPETGQIMGRNRYALGCLDLKRVPMNHPAQWLSEYVTHATQPRSYLSPRSPLGLPKPNPLLVPLSIPPPPPPPLREGFQTHRGVLRVGAGGLGCFRHFSSVPPIPLSGREMGAVREFGIPFYKALVKGVSERYGSWGVALQQKTVFNWQRGPASDFGHFHGILVGAAYWVGLHPHLNPTQSRWVSKP